MSTLSRAVLKSEFSLRTRFCRAPASTRPHYRHVAIMDEPIESLERGTMKTAEEFHAFCKEMLAVASRKHEEEKGTESGPKKK